MYFNEIVPKKGHLEAEIGKKSSSRVFGFMIFGDLQGFSAKNPTSYRNRTHKKFLELPMASPCLVAGHFAVPWRAGALRRFVGLSVG